MDVPIKVASHYSRRHSNTPDTKAGAKVRGGFTDSPDTNAKKSMSRPTIPPITIPPKPLKPFVYANTIFTATSKAEACDLMIVARHD